MVIRQAVFFKLRLFQDTGVQKALVKFYPTKEWQENALEDFTQLRNFVSNANINEPNNGRVNPEDFIKRTQKSPPTFSEITKYSQAAKVMMLHVISEHINNFDNTTGIPDTLGTWIYAILALLEKPLTPDCCFKLREFAKKCASIRASFQDDLDEKIAVPLNLYICIIAKYFNQLDLAD